MVLKLPMTIWESILSWSLGIVSSSPSRRGRRRTNWVRQAVPAGGTLKAHRGLAFLTRDLGLQHAGRTLRALRLTRFRYGGHGVSHVRVSAPAPCSSQTIQLSRRRYEPPERDPGSMAASTR